VVARLVPRGRPKLGVVAREVTLLPRHWEWLATQPGGASVALRRLVEAAPRALFANDATRFADLSESWPRDVRDHARQLSGFS
jgi:hypothetical protein